MGRPLVLDPNTTTGDIRIAGKVYELNTSGSWARIKDKETGKVLTVDLRPDYIKEREEGFKKKETSGKQIYSDDIDGWAREIFDLDPNITCIPVAIEYPIGSTYYTVVDLDEIFETCYDYLSDDVERANGDRKCRGSNDGLVMPWSDDSITLGTWRRIVDLWIKMCENSGISKAENEGDYCEYSHLDVYAYLRNCNKIEMISLY